MVIFELVSLAWKVHVNQLLSVVEWISNLSKLVEFTWYTCIKRKFPECSTSCRYCVKEAFATAGYVRVGVDVVGYPDVVSTKNWKQLNTKTKAVSKIAVLLKYKRAFICRVRFVINQKIANTTNDAVKAI
jgi:hypothetical protein